MYRASPASGDWIQYAMAIYPCPPLRSCFAFFQLTAVYLPLFTINCGCSLLSASFKNTGTVQSTPYIVSSLGGTSHSSSGLGLSHQINSNLWLWYASQTIIGRGFNLSLIPPQCSYDSKHDNMRYFVEFQFDGVIPLLVDLCQSIYSSIHCGRTFSFFLLIDVDDAFLLLFLSSCCCCGGGGG